MADEKLVELLKRSVEEFNQWRANNPGKRVDLHFENLNGANLNGANLNGADLSNADLSNADLSHANLRQAILRPVDLSGADLSYANLREADMATSSLEGAKLSDADLSGLSLSETDLSGANLRGVNLSGAKVRLSQLRSATGVTQEQIDSTDIIPEEDESAEQSSVNTKELAEKSKVYKVVKVQIDHADFLIQTADTIRKRTAVNLTEEQDRALNDLLEIIKGLQEKVKELEAERDELKSRLPDQWRSKLPDIAAAFPKGGLFAAGQETVERITDSEIVQELLSKATESLQEVFSSWLM